MDTPDAGEIRDAVQRGQGSSDPDDARERDRHTPPEPTAGAGGEPGEDARRAADAARSRDPAARTGEAG